MVLQTCSEVISFTRKLEEDSARFYEKLAERRPENSEVLLSLARENRKNITMVERAYYGVITDALEGCFAFSIEPERYVFPLETAEAESVAQALEKALEMENRAKCFFTDAAEQSRSLMADVPRALSILARKRHDRISILKSLL